MLVKALALGASACLTRGRPQLWGWRWRATAGVAHVLDILRREIDRVMGLMWASRGSATLAPTNCSAPRRTFRAR